MIDGVHVVGRKFKPVALGITVMMVGLVVAGLFNLGDYAHPQFQLYGSFVPFAAAVLLIAGFVRSDTRLTRYGLLIALFAYLGRAIFLVIEDPLGDSVLLAVGTTIIIAGSYVLETQDRGRT